MNKSPRGSLTVEAACIIPIILFTIFALIYLSFYLHDICRIQGILNRTLNKTSLIAKHDSCLSTGEIYYETINQRGVFYHFINNNKDEEELIRSYLQQELSKGLFLVEVSNIQVIKDLFFINASVSIETSISIPYIRKLFTSYSSREIVGKSLIHNPPEFIRLAEVIMDTGQEIKGVEELKEKFIEVINKVR